VFQKQVLADLRSPGTALAAMFRLPVRKLVQAPGALGFPFARRDPARQLRIGCSGHACGRNRILPIGSGKKSRGT